jgi:hypothetical protein
VALYFAHSGTSLDLYCVLSPGWLAARPNPFFVSAESSSFRINQQHPTYGLGKVRTTPVAARIQPADCFGQNVVHCIDITSPAKVPLLGNFRLTLRYASKLQSFDGIGVGGENTMCV